MRLPLGLALLKAEKAARKSTDWRNRLKHVFPRYLWHELSPPHVELWKWIDAIKQDTSPRPFVAIWPRGRGKSTHAEIAVVDLGARKKRTYCMYVCGTQDQADKHIATITNMMESDDVVAKFPHMGNPRVGKNGSRSWNRTIVTTESGFTVEAVGLNKAVRGQKVDWARPDLIVFDDIDERHDTENAVKKKRNIITTSILPAGAPNCAVVFCQNVIHDGSIAHELSSYPGRDGAATYLMERIISGPHKAIDDLKYKMSVEEDSIRWSIIEGISPWIGFDIPVCEAEMNLFGPDAFELESQHNINADNPFALLSGEIIDATRRIDYPDLVTIAVGVDPSGGAGGCGIVATGKAKIGKDWHGFTIDNRSTPPGTSSSKWAENVLWCYHANNADVIVVEVNFGGDMVKENIRNAVIRDSDGEILLSGKTVTIVEVSASRGKEVRAQPIATLFQLGKMHHVGRYPKLQRQWTGWEPGTKPSPDELDAEVWAVTYLNIAGNNLSASQLVDFA